MWMHVESSDRTYSCVVQCVFLHATFCNILGVMSHVADNAHVHTRTCTHMHMYMIVHVCPLTTSGEA